MSDDPAPPVMVTNALSFGTLEGEKKYYKLVLFACCHGSDDGSEVDFDPSQPLWLKANEKSRVHMRVQLGQGNKRNPEAAYHFFYEGLWVFGSVKATEEASEYYQVSWSYSRQHSQLLRKPASVWALHGNTGRLIKPFLDITRNF